MIQYPGRTQLLSINPFTLIERPRGNSALYNSLISYWKLDEASGSRADSFGSNTLTDNSTVGSTTGHVYETCANFNNAEQEYLSASHNSGLTTGDVQFWTAGWVKRNSNANGHLWGKGWASGATTREWVLYHDTATQKVSFYVGYSTSSVASIAQNGTVGNSTWIFFVAWHDSVANTINIQTDNGTVASLSHTGGVHSASNIFHISIDTGSVWNGQIGPVMFGKNYIPTADDRTFLYNSGAGRTLAAMAAY